MSMLGAGLIEILNRSITICYVVIVVLAVRFLIRRFPKKYSYCLWGIVGLRLLFPASISSPLSLFNLKPFQDILYQSGQGMEYISEKIGYMAQPEIHTGIPAVNEAVNQLLPEGNPAGSVNPMQVYLLIGAWIWVIGIAALLIYAAVSYFRLKNRVRYAVLFSRERDREEEDFSAEENRFIKWKRTSRKKACIYQCEEIASPFVMGIWKPCIYIPLHLPEEERQYILAHEVCHIRRKDYLVKALFFLLSCVYWFHPLVWLSYFFMISDMEMSCDEYVLGKMGNEIKQDYSRTLLRFAKVKDKRFSGPLAFGESSVGKRVKNVLNYRKPTFWITVILILAVAGLALVCLTDRMAENVLVIGDAPKSSPHLFASGCSHSFEPNMNGGLIYADFYEKGSYQGRTVIAELDFQEQNREGEGVLTIVPDQNEETGILGISISYAEGPVSQFAGVTLEKPGMGISMSRPEPDNSGIRPDVPKMITALYLGDDQSGQVEMFPIRYLEKMNPDSKEFRDKLSANQVSVIIYMVISEQDSGTLKEAYMGG